MEEFDQGHFTGERALFKKRDARIANCLFDDGESPLKEGRNLEVVHTTFGWKYPLWYGKGHKVKDCLFLKMARSGIWYTTDSLFEDCRIEAPKEFRRCQNIQLKNLVFLDAEETLWECEKVRMESIQAKGDYFGMNSADLEIDGLTLDGNYCFDGSKNILIRNSTLNSKDAFWNCENVTAINCTVIGEYFGWNSKNVTLRNCHIESHQGFCYMKNLTLDHCTIDNSDLIFEYCEDIQADVDSPLASVKNPISGEIHCLSIDELIQDEPSIDLEKIRIRTEK